MYPKFLRLNYIAIIIACNCGSAIAQSNSYGHENWPGKNGIVKTHIEVPESLVFKYNLNITRGSNDEFLFFDIIQHENKSINKGRLQLEIFSSPADAQVGLVNYLNNLSTPFKPPRLSSESFNFGDVAFGEENDGIFRVAFIRNNVLVIIFAPTDKAKSIAREIDRQIQLAPEWKSNTTKPSFKLKKNEFTL